MYMRVSTDAREMQHENNAPSTVQVWHIERVQSVTVCKPDVCAEHDMIGRII